MAENPQRTSLVLEPAEEELLTKLLARLAAKGGAALQEGNDHLTWALIRLEKIWESIQVHPSILRGQTLGARHRDLESLVETLSSCHPYSTEVFIPTRGTLVRAFLHAKLNFCRLLGLIFAEMLADDQMATELKLSIERVQTSAVCNIMAEDLLRMIASDQNLTPVVRRRATWVLVQVWEDRACRVVNQFFPVLDSVWQAKSHITINYGTLSGASELLTMLSIGCDPVFVDCFSVDETTDEQEFALQEFVFNFSYEQLQQLQQTMETTGTTNVDAHKVASILEIPVQELHVQTCTCEEMIFTFRERQLMANNRRAVGLPGPTKTAEEYLMIYLLEAAGDVEHTACDEKRLDSNSP